jgi:hypothetical protein
MPIEVRCEGCGRNLRVADEHAGKALRCPACNHISKAPAVSTSLLGDLAAPPPRWHMRTPEGQAYGPVTDDELDRWVREGRLAGDCELATSDAGPWQPATVKFPSLARPQQVPAPAPAPVPAPTFHAASPFAAGQAGQPARYFIPHRGGLILVLGLLGFVVGCPIFSLMAWVMGSGDLREIRSGRMDPSGEQLTRAGQILGMVVAIPCIVLSALVLVVMVIAAVNG